ncbi:diguanylate cyclase [Anaeromyxobacter oryzae]|uniref:diguanylate cyclase n=1 Tax=Anaeromyxobacter oryzae TaxID=2918170 RepID=A0ABM7WRS6_9BACT|nr:diguanylate cyclase [Anaeromyxobacter oryzae]BDG02187.1 diguanylate cyclase response regulator [Anaeromyxobacter oryzae]
MPGHRARILVVDDSRTQLEWLVKVLDREGYLVATAADGKEAIRKVRGEPPDLVLLDMVLPDMDGLEVLRIVKARPEDRFIPVIILSVKADLDSKVTGLRIGADDFLAKPFAEAEILARCAAMLRIKSLQDQLRETQRKLAEQAITDELTGLKNRRAFDERLQEEFRRAQRYSDPVSLIMIDLDHFKQVNDRFGHPFGDVVLRGAAEQLCASTRDPDICARYGGEEFAVILPKTHLQGALSVAERIWKELGGRRYPVPPGTPATGLGADGALHVTASMGLAFYPSKDIGSPELLLRYADEALYQAKRSGRNTICLYQAQSYRYDAGGR